MNEETARELASAIIGDFEELLAEHNIVIPSADREGREEEACIYGRSTIFSRMQSRISW